MGGLFYSSICACTRPGSCCSKLLSAPLRRNGVSGLSLASKYSHRKHRTDSVVPRLADLCYERVRDGQCDTKDLYALTPDQMVEMISRLQQDFKATATERDELASKLKDRYTVDPPCWQKRVDQAVWDHRCTVVSKWLPNAVPGAKALPFILSKDRLELKWDVPAGRFVLISKAASRFYAAIEERCGWLQKCLASGADTQSQPGVQ
ncbi:hypothetical protein WJX73_009208 [Symbiochloris irregularis]|uniref:Uncharacterized protein n=1 Tax=Symbiochloris irregularis TaxID=706552 RepID=A0AAW1PDH4_9CHLO